MLAAAVVHIVAGTAMAATLDPECEEALLLAAVPVVPVTALTAVVPVTVMVWLSRLRSHDASLAPPRAHRTSQRRSPLLRLCQYLRFLPAEQKEQQH